MDISDSNKKRWKYCPVGFYDTDCLEMWLNKKAKEGWILSKRGFMGHFGLMIPGSKNTKYKVFPSTPEGNVYRDMVSDLEEKGWDYVYKFWGWNDVTIFASEREDAQEMHTDSEAELMEHRKGRNRLIRPSYIWLPIIIVAWIVRHFFLNNNIHAVDSTSFDLKIDILRTCMISIPILVMITLILIDRRRRLNKNYILTESDYKKHAIIHVVFRIMLAAAVVFLIALAIYNAAQHIDFINDQLAVWRD